MAKQSKEKPCPCGNGQAFEQCCQPLLNNDQPAASAVALMRSRYSAYTLGNKEYLLRTWHSSTRPGQFGLDGHQQNWQRLKIIDTVAGQSGDDSGEVEFIAIYKVNGRAERLHERSRFERENQLWRYIDGTIINPA
ncbi:MAG: YchJ family metal-binding protein [Porticoccaceae bacterium]|nr:YchJ family metal-binding protein [Porticoccaceae bacterium]